MLHALRESFTDSVSLGKWGKENLIFAFVEKMQVRGRPESFRDGGTSCLALGDFEIRDLKPPCSYVILSPPHPAHAPYGRTHHTDGRIKSRMPEKKPAHDKGLQFVRKVSGL